MTEIINSINESIKNIEAMHNEIEERLDAKNADLEAKLAALHK